MQTAAREERRDLEPDLTPPPDLREMVRRWNLGGVGVNDPVVVRRHPAAAGPQLQNNGVDLLSLWRVAAPRCYGVLLSSIRTTIVAKERQCTREEAEFQVYMDGRPCSGLASRQLGLKLRPRMLYLTTRIQISQPDDILFAEAQSWRLSSLNDPGSPHDLGELFSHMDLSDFKHRRFPDWLFE